MQCPGCPISLRFLIAEIFKDKESRTDQNDPNAYIDIDIAGIASRAIAVDSNRACEFDMDETSLIIMVFQPT